MPLPSLTSRCRADLRKPRLSDRHSGIRVPRLRNGMRRALAAGWLWALVIGFAPAIAQNTGLPELGTSASRHLSKAEETRIGQTFYRQLVISPGYVGDYPLYDYIQSLGDRISAHSDLRGVRPVFSLYRDNAINAYAVPGGYITLNTGLLLTADNESELAAVVAHEIAHLTQRHLPRLIERTAAQKLPTLAAILASIVVGGETGIAGVTAAAGASASSQLAYTREFEREADAIGIRLLADSGFDPRAMPEFFAKLDRATIHSGREVPEFLRTHPMSHARMAASQDRAAAYPERDYPDSLDYLLARARIRALLTVRQEDPLLYLRDQTRSESRLEREAADYGMAVVLHERREFANALDLVQPLSLRYPDHPWIHSLYAQIELSMGDPEAAIARYRNLFEAHPEELYISYYLANAYLENDQPELARRHIRKQLRRHPEDLILYKVQTRIHVALDQHAEADQSKAEYLVLMGNYGGAVSVLKRALRNTDEEGYLGQSITARIKELEPRVQ